MHQRSIPLFQASKRPTIFSLLFLCVLLILTASCAHKTWDINRYIQALERPERDQHQQPEKVLEALNLTPGMMVIDLGAGSGYFTRRLAESVGENGRVIAIDVEQKMLNYNKARLEQLGLANRVRFILAGPEGPVFSGNNADIVFLCDVYHHLKKQINFLANTKPALKPNGRVVIIDYYNDERSGTLGFSKSHLVPKEQVIKDMGQAGFTLSQEHAFLPRQYFLEFVSKKEGSAPTQMQN
ncbi:methyltransferase domain-containing protein [uncultured Nitrospira sp.]|uniref:class I SAM-dependent methyltransferase n=1 Tax=uncultured Nitrospira sp. TaxID=157176 RepID=UPI003140915E